MPPHRLQTLAAFADRILPGAVAAGALEYMDYWVRRPPFEPAQHEIELVAHLAERTARQRFTKAFVACTAAEQDAVLAEFVAGNVQGKSFDGKEAFKRLVVLTLESFLADPKYGGNRDEVGWRFIGHEACWWSPHHRGRSLGAVRGGLPY